MPTELYLPKMSDHMEKGIIIKWLVNEGDAVKKGQPILEIETDKVVAEVEAPASGVLRGVRASAGMEVPVGETIAFVAQTGEEIPQLPPIAPEEQAEGKDQAVSEPSALAAQPSDSGRAHAEEGVAAGTRRIRAAPAARRLAREKGLDLTQISGTGPGGRITKQDVLRYTETLAVKSTDLDAVTLTSAADADVEWLELSTMRRITGERLTLSWQTAPHFTLTMEADMSEAGLLREALMERIVAETGRRLSYTALVVKMVACALKRHPLANAEFAGGRIKLHGQANVGVAMAIKGGLLVPVIRSADTLSFAEISRHLGEFREKAASMSFTLDDLSGGTFTLSNLGMFGVDQFSAIINPPQSAILALGRIAKRPTALPDGGSGLRPIMTMTLSVDHRVLDGVDGARFLSEVKNLLENPYALL